MIWVPALVAALIPAMISGTPVSETYKGKLVEEKEITDFVNKSCTMHGAQDKIPQVMGSIERFQTCVQNLTIDMDSILSSDEHRKDDVGEKIKRYCGLAPQMKNCTYFLLDFIEMCGDKDEPVDKDDVDGARRLVDQLVGYVCHKDGERVTSFLKEGGVQCIQNNSKALAKCTAFIADQIESDDDEDNSEENDVCEVFEYTSNCILSSMEGCAEKPIKITKDLSAHLRKVMNCTVAEDTGLKVYKQWLQARTTLK